LGDLGTTVVAKRNTLDIILLMYMKICENQSDLMEMGDPSPATHSSATKKEKEKEEEEEEKVKIKRENPPPFPPFPQLRPLQPPSRHCML